MVANPLPKDCESEIAKAVHILREFTADSSNGPDKLIPPSIFAKAKGIAVISYCKMGFFVSARGGSGIVVAKLPGGGWSAPSAVGVAGIGGGLEFGAEMTAIIMMLMYKNAVKAFMKGKNLTLGGGISVAAGPIGRDLEADVAVKSPAAMYTYAKAKGLFVGISLSGTVILERKKCNEKFYGPGTRAYDILSGSTKPPKEADMLYEVLKEQTRVAKRKAAKQAIDLGSKAIEKKYGVKGLNNAANRAGDDALEAEDKYHKKSSFMTKRPTIKTKSSIKLTASRSAPTRPKKGPAPKPQQKTLQQIAGSYSPVAEKKQPPPRPPPVGTTSTTSARPKQYVEALYNYTAQMSCDLSFQKEDKIELLACTKCEFDWWEGQINGQKGIFPANYVKILC